jgi:uncharacterized membrane protein YkvA (DUF1232 family)
MFNAVLPSVSGELEILRTMATLVAAMSGAVSAHLAVLRAQAATTAFTAITAVRHVISGTDIIPDVMEHLFSHMRLDMLVKLRIRAC